MAKLTLPKIGGGIEGGPLLIFASLLAILFTFLVGYAIYQGVITGESGDDPPVVVDDDDGDDDGDDFEDPFNPGDFVFEGNFLDDLQLWCGEGDIIACEDLYFESPIGSAWEQFAEERLGFNE